MRARLVLTPCNFQYSTHGLQPSSPSNSGRDVSISRSLPPSFFSSSRWTSSADLNLRHNDVVCVLQLGHVFTLISSVHFLVVCLTKIPFSRVSSYAHHDTDSRLNSSWSWLIWRRLVWRLMASHFQSTIDKSYSVGCSDPACPGSG